MDISGRQIFAGIVLLVIGLVGGVAIASAMNGNGISEDEQAVEVEKIIELTEMYQSTLNAGDFEQWMTVWAADAVRMPPDGPQSVGIEAIRSTVAPAFDLFDFEEFQIDPEVIEVLGDIAYTRGQYEFSMTPKEGGATLHFTGKFFSLLEKQADGSWKFTVDCFNYNGPPE